MPRSPLPRLSMGLASSPSSVVCDGVSSFQMTAKSRQTGSTWAGAPLHPCWRGQLSCFLNLSLHLQLWAALLVPPMLTQPSRLTPLGSKVCESHSAWSLFCRCGVRSCATFCSGIRHHLLELELCLWTAVMRKIDETYVWPEEDVPFLTSLVAKQNKTSVVNMKSVSTYQLFNIIDVNTNSVWHAFDNPWIVYK